MSKRGCLENSPAFPKYIVPSGPGCSGRRGPSVFNNPQGIFPLGFFGHFCPQELLQHNIPRLGCF